MRKELVVTRRVAVGPELGPREARLGQPLADTAGLLRAAAVGAEEPAGETARSVALEPGAHDVVDAEDLAKRPDVRLERRRRKDHDMTELAVPAESGGRVVAQPARDERATEVGAEPVEGGAVEAAKRQRMRALSAGLDLAAARARASSSGWRASASGSLTPAALKRNGRHAIRACERAVDVERSDDRPRGWGFGHRRTRLYTRCMSDGPEIFDDLYLGLQAGGAIRKQRRGEELTEEEREAIGRWQQMSMWRKGDRRRRLRGRHVRARLHPRRPRVRPPRPQGLERRSVAWLEPEHLPRRRARATSPGARGLRGSAGARSRRGDGARRRRAARSGARAGGRGQSRRAARR